MHLGPQSPARAGCYSCPHRAAHVTGGHGLMSPPTPGPEARGLRLDVFVKGDSVCLWFIQPHPVQGWGSGRTRTLSPDRLTGPGSRASAAGKGRFPEALVEGEVVTILILVSSGSERKAECSRPTSGGRTWAEDCHLWAERGEVRVTMTTAASVSTEQKDLSSHGHSAWGSSCCCVPQGNILTSLSRQRCWPQCPPQCPPQNREV